MWIGMKCAVRPSVCAVRPSVCAASLVRLALLARGFVSLARRCAGIFGRLRRKIELGAQCGVVGAQRFDLPGQAFDRFRLRKNEAKAARRWASMAIPRITDPI